MPQGVEDLQELVARLTTGRGAHKLSQVCSICCLHASADAGGAPDGQSAMCRVCWKSWRGQLRLLQARTTWTWIHS